MSQADSTRRLTSQDIDKMYHKTVLKVPDCFGLQKQVLSREMVNTKREHFQVKFCSKFRIFFYIF